MLSQWGVSSSFPLCAVSLSIHVSNFTNTIITFIYYSSNDIQPSTLITDQSPSRLLLDIKVTGIYLVITPYI